MGNTPTPATTILGRGGGGGVKKLSLGAEMLSVDQFQASPSCLALITEPLNACIDCIMVPMQRAGREGSAGRTQQPCPSYEGQGIEGAVGTRSRQGSGSMRHILSGLLHVHQPVHFTASPDR